MTAVMGSGREGWRGSLSPPGEGCARLSNPGMTLALCERRRDDAVGVEAHKRSLERSGARTWRRFGTCGCGWR